MPKFIYAEVGKRKGAINDEDKYVRPIDRGRWACWLISRDQRRDCIANGSPILIGVSHEDQ
jgi:hypothetical protein